MKRNNKILKSTSTVKMLILICIMAFSINESQGYDAIINGIAYNLIGDEAIVVAGSHNSNSLVIPSVIEVGGKSFEVTAIDSRAFYQYTDLRSISFSSKIKAIGGMAFYGCSSITEVILPTNIEYVGTLAFGECKSLTKLITPLPLSDSHITGTKNLTYTLTQVSNTSINRNNVPLQCVRVVKLPTGIETLEDNALSGCPYLYSIELPESIKKIGNNCFFNCTSLSSITLPNSIQYIGNMAFYGCTSLYNINFSFSFAPIHIGTMIFDNTPWKTNA